jgi:hypothetical protein
MALEGDIKEFGLADVIQLIASSQKTGVIFLDRAEEQASISFKDGEITGAIYRKAGKQDQLHEFLFRAKMLDQDTVRKVLQIQSDTGLSVDEILIKEYLMTREEVENAIITKIQEVIDDVFTWRDAHYRFDSDAGLYSHSRARVSISAEPLLMEAMRRKDEWPMIVRTIPSDDTVLEKAGDKPLPGEVEPDAYKLFQLMEGRHKVAELAEMSGLGRFRTYAAAHILVQLGAIKKVEATRPVPQTKPEAAKYPEFKLGAEILWGAASLVVVLAAVILSFWQAPKPRTDRWNTVERYQKSLILGDLRQRLEIYRYGHGHYPDSLSQVSEPKEVLGIEYQRSGDSLAYSLK